MDVGCAAAEHTADPVGSTAGPVVAPAPGLHAADPVLCPGESIVADLASVSISDDFWLNTQLIPLELVQTLLRRQATGDRPSFVVGA